MSSSYSGHPVVVGADGSPAGLTAAALAADEAVRRRRPLRVVHAFSWPLLGVPLGPAPGAPIDTPLDGGLRVEAERLVAEAVDLAVSRHPDLPVTGQVVTGAIAPVLLHEAAGADLLVLGDRGLGGFTGLLMGSVAVQLTAHAPCPVLVARGETHPDGPIVVGVDGSATSVAAIDFALQAADQRGATVLAVHAWTHPTSTGPGDMLPPVYDVDQVTQESDRLLAELLAGRSERYPDVSVARDVVHTRPAPALLERSAKAALLVVGSRGRGGFTGLLLGSVSQAALHHSACPVAVVRRPASTG